jgi:hypothetical protein
MHLRALGLVALAGVTLGAAGQRAEPLRLEAAGFVNHPPVAEMSGIVKSRRHEDLYWVHNDSGHPARLFAIRATGEVVKPAGSDDSYPGILVRGARNVDWEDIAIDGGTLYIGDVGNNGNGRRDLGVYVVSEPDPTRDVEVAPVRRLLVAYPDQREFPPKNRHFDCEAMFVFRGKLFFLTKHRQPNGVLPENGTNLYRLDTEHADRVNVLTKVDSKDDLGGWVTAADLSPDGKTLAVLTHFPEASIWLFETPASGDRFLSSPSRRIRMTNAKQCEAICWVDGNTLLVTNEQREIFRIGAN